MFYAILFTVLSLALNMPPYFTLFNVHLTLSLVFLARAPALSLFLPRYIGTMFSGVLRLYFHTFFMVLVYYSVSLSVSLVSIVNIH
jgi:hypothetical protein